MSIKHTEVQEPSFVWPPTPSSLIQPDIQPTDAPLPISIRPNALIESIETHLLGRTGLAFDIWAQRTGWQPDTLVDYCWRCGGSIGAHESDGEGCAECRGKSLPWDRAIRLGKYSGVLRTEILGLKFHKHRNTGVGLGKYLGRAIADELIKANISPEQAALVPIPMHRFRRIARGVDHTRVIAKSTSSTIGCPIMAMLHSRNRPEQVGLSMTARAANIKDAFWVTRRNERLLEQLANSQTENKIRVFILIDDVRTTGATFVAACKALKSALQSRKPSFTDLYEQPQIWTACVGVAGETRRRGQDVPGGGNQ